MFAPSTARAMLTPLYALWQELRAIPDTSSESSIAHAKLSWWYDETREMLAGKARHPITKALAPTVARYEGSARLIHAAIEAMMARATDPSYTDYAALIASASRARGSIEQLAAHVTGLDNPSVDANLAEIGARLEATALLRDVGADAARGRCYLPLDDLARHGVDAARLYAGELNDALHALIVFQAGRLQRELAEHLSRLDAGVISRLRAVFADVEIARRLLRRMETLGARILRERPRLTPMSQLFIAWRASRRAARSTS